MVKNNVAGRVAGAVMNVKGQIPDAYGVLVLEPAVGLERLTAEAPATAVLRKLRDPVSIRFVWPFDRYPQLFRQHTGFAAVIDVAMSQQDFFDPYAGLFGSRFEPLKIAAWINEGSPQRAGAPQQTTILLERGDRRDRRAQRRSFVHFGT